MGVPLLKIFPIIVKRTVTTGGGPNPTDAFALRLNFPDSNAAPTDAVTFALVFPDTVGPQSDAAKLGLLFADVSPAIADALSRLGITFADSIPGAADGFSLGLAFSESNLSPSDLVKLGIAYADTNPTLSDALLKLSLTFGDTNAAPTDAATYLIQLAQAESNAALTDVLSQMKINGLGDSNVAPSDGRSATATWTQGATTAAGTGNWTTPANAQGLRDGTNANLTDGALDSNAGTLTLDPYPDPTADFSTWAISTVTFRLFGVGTNFSLSPANPSLFLESSIDGAAWSTIETVTANFDNSAAGNPRLLVPPTPGGGWTWANINNLRFRCRYVTGIIAVTGTVNIDAVELKVVATKSPL